MMTFHPTQKTEPGIYIHWEPCSCGEKHRGISNLQQSKAEHNAKLKVQGCELARKQALYEGAK